MAATRAVAAAGAGTGDPYWAPPEAEAPRFERIEEALRGCARIPGRDFGYDGIRAYGRNPDNVVLIMAKSQNDNVIVWEYANEGAAGPQILVYWLNIEPSTRREHLEKGNKSLISKLSAVEEMLCGAQCEVVVDPSTGSKRYLVNIRAEQLRARKMELMLDADGTPFLGGSLSKKRARVESAYIQLRRGLTAAALLAPAAIEDIRIYGTDVDAASATYGQRIAESLRETQQGAGGR
jgi:hypothetical protein